MTNKKESKDSLPETTLKNSKKNARAYLVNERVIIESSDEGRELYAQSRFGNLIEDGKVQLSLLEALYLMERNKITIHDQKNKIIEFEKFVKKANKVEVNFWTRYCVFKDMRSRGFIIKTALKFGADFRIYDRGIKPGEDHAKWVVFPVREGSSLTWHDFAAKNRVAHSTKKKLLLGVVDDESDVTYYECKWIRP
jgi:tRNA-intron endonuclease